jgi:HSP20 family protein
MVFFEPFSPLFELSRDRRFAGEVTASFVPAADVVATDEDVTVTMDVPGLKSEDITIELRDDVLTIQGERGFPYQRDGDENRRVWQRLERGFGKFERVLRLPRDLDGSKITASMNDGVLTVTIPKPEARKPRRIDIGVDGRSATIEGTASESRSELAGAGTYRARRHLPRAKATAASAGPGDRELTISTRRPPGPPSVGGHRPPTRRPSPARCRLPGRPGQQSPAALGWPAACSAAGIREPAGLTLSTG